MKYTLYIFCFMSVSSVYAQDVKLIPQPVELKMSPGGFQIRDNLSIGYNKPEAKPIAEILAKKINTSTGYQVKTDKKGKIMLSLNEKVDPALGKEGYTLVSTSKSIKIEANEPAGLFYGVQTLLQLAPKEIESSTKINADWKIPAVQIRDYPRFAWRGVMLDVSRHFFTKEEVKKYIDEISRYKYNVFHWHLTDDQGWRIEIKSLPKLTSIGAWRVPRVGKWGTFEAPKSDEPATDGGFYTQEDIKEIVQFAQNRFITVLPEVDVPGHSMAAIASYPELCCTKDPSIRVNPGSNFAEWPGDGHFVMSVDNSLNPSDEKVYAFLDKVFTEMAALFPSPYIHVGGDECYKGYWEKSDACKRMMKLADMKNTEELQGYFMRRIEQILKSKNKKMIGWDEILEGGLGPQAAVMSWRGTQGGIAAARLGHEVVMTPNPYTYIDLRQGDPSVEPDGTSYLYVPLSKCYSFEPVPDSVDAKYILGGQANLWTEKAPTLRHAEYLTFPRAWALSEVYWSPKGKKNWSQFVDKLDGHFERADAAEVNYARSVYDAIAQPKMVGKKLMVGVNNEISDMDTYYTLNETMPDKFSRKLTEPVEIPEGKVTLKLVTYRNEKKVGKVIALSREELISRAPKEKESKIN